MDYSICECNLAFEYDGQQHFEPVRFVGMSIKQAQQRFQQQQEWDKRKNKLCKERGYVLVRIAYNEDLSEDCIRRKL